MVQPTKKALADSLVKLLAKMPLDKITIVDLVEDDGVNGQTFYYYFCDIYDLVEWCFSNEVAQVLKDTHIYDTWYEAFCRSLPLSLIHI